MGIKCSQIHLNTPLQARDESDWRTFDNDKLFATHFTCRHTDSVTLRVNSIMLGAKSKNLALDVYKRSMLEVSPNLGLCKYEVTKTVL